MCGRRENELPQEVITKAWEGIELLTSPDGFCLGPVVTGTTLLFAVYNAPTPASLLPSGIKMGTTVCWKQKSTSIGAVVDYISSPPSCPFKSSSAPS